MSNLTLRLLTALVGIPVLLGAAYLGGWIFGLLVLALALLGQHELYRMLEKAGTRPYATFGLVLGGFLGLRMLLPGLLPVALFLGVLLLAAIPFLSVENPLERLGATLLGVAYPTLLLMMLVDLREAAPLTGGELEAFYLVLSLFILVWTTDALAYFTGRALGHHALAPAVSPNKTREGAVGGLLGALAAGLVLGLTVLGFLPFGHVIVLAFLVAVFGQLGDLTESALKRSVEVKDSGTLLPGHGGVLDRFDALILAAPIFFIYLRYVACAIS